MALATVILLTLIAVAVLARRQIAQREEARKLAELEFAAMLAEQNWPTRELRDTIAQECNAVSRQKALAQHSAQNRNGRRRDAALATARGIVHRCRAEARESILDMRSHLLEQTDLLGALAGRAGGDAPEQGGVAVLRSGRCAAMVAAIPNPFRPCTCPTLA